MVFSDGRPEDEESSDFQEVELRANQNHNFNSVASSSHSKQEIPGCSIVKPDSGSMICTREADEVRTCGANDYSSGEMAKPDGPGFSRYKVTEVEYDLSCENSFCHTNTVQTSVGTSSGSITPASRPAPSVLPSSRVSNSPSFLKVNAEPSVISLGRSDSGNPIRNNAETCQSSALGRAGNTGSIDVVSRSGVACQIRSNSIQNSTLLGRLSVEGIPSVEQPTQDADVTPSQGTIRNSSEGSPGDSSEDLNEESGTLRWMQALEFQGTGACRVDERLRPLLRWNVSCVRSDGRLLVKLGQHFKAKELNLLARCLCAPLVHIRVGKVLREGRLLLPTTSRGFLSLTMVPGSILRLSFIPDTGCVDLLATINLSSDAPSVSLEEILADVSGRTFLLKLPDGKVLYFWQSEKSKSTGDELVSKMKDLLSRRPTVSQMTGIEETRLDSFANYICSACNGSSSTEVVQSPASATHAESLHSCTRSSCAPSTIRTSSHASTSFNGERHSLSLPTAFTRSSAEFEGDSSFRPGGLIQGMSQRGISVENTPPFSTPNTGSSASWHDGSQIRHVTMCSRRGSSVGPTASFSGAREVSSSNTHDQPVLLASSWSTRTSLSESSAEKQETSSLSAGLYTSLNTELSGHRHDVFDRTSHLAHHGNTDFSLRSSLPSFLGESTSPSCTNSPTLSSHRPVSSSSLIGPSYCPCPLGTFARPYVPSAIEGGLLSPSTPFFSVRPPPSLFPPGSLSFHEFSLSPVQLPVSTLVTSAIPIHSSGLSPFCSQPVTSVPILHKPTPYMGRTSSALSGYSITPSEGLEKSFYSCLRARQAMRDESCSVNLSNNSCPGVSAWQLPFNLEAFTSVFDPSLALNASTPCINSSTISATQTQRSVLDTSLAGTPGLVGSFESGLHTQTHQMFTSMALSQVTPSEVRLHYASRFVEENREGPTPGIVDQVSSLSSERKFKQRRLFEDMVTKNRNVPGQTLHSPESCSASGGSRTGESNPSFSSESAEDSSHATVKDMGAKRSQHVDKTLKMEEEKNQ